MIQGNECILLSFSVQLTGVLFTHVPLSYLGEVLGSDLPDVHGEDDEVEVPLDVVHDFVLEVHLPLVRGDVEGHLVLDDRLTDVLDTFSAQKVKGQGRIEPKRLSSI